LPDYLTIHSISKIDIESFNSKSLAKKIVQFDSKFKFRKNDVVLLGVEESRGSQNKNSKKSPDIVRKQLYSLSDFFQKQRIVDLGNLKQGNTLADTYAALQFVISELIHKHVYIVLLGGTQNLTNPCFNACEKAKRLTNIVSVDSRFDIGIEEEIDVSQNHVGNILKKGSKFLFDYSNIGYQSYFVSKEDIDLLNTKLLFEATRLGKARAELYELEPCLRDAHIVSFDIGAIRSESAPGNYYASPNGFTAEEACQISRYAGLGNSIFVFGVFEFNPSLDINNQTAMLIAQMIWYFIDGLNYKKEDANHIDLNKFIKYIVKLNNEYTITFYKSELTNRWWFEIPYQKLKDRNALISCSYKDYLRACEQEVPDRWWRSYQKIN